MKHQEYVTTIKQLLNLTDKKDAKFLKQLCTIIVKHLEKKSGSDIKQNSATQLRATNEEQRIVEKITKKLHSANAEQLKELDIFVRHYLMRKE